MATKKNLQDLSNAELWELFPIIISEHKDHWANDYISEEKMLVSAIGRDNIIRINHIGSTSVPGLPAKPTIDILMEVVNEIDTEGLIDKMKSTGYIYSPQPNNPAPHMMFMKGYTIQGFDGQVYHVHVRYSGDWDELYFRDYLKVHPEVAREYGELKIQLQKLFEHDRDGYTVAKTEFIRKVTGRARTEFPDRYRPR